MKNKKAELTTQQIVILIVLLVSFVVLLFFLYKLNPKELSEKQICYNSVMLSDEKSFFSNIDCKTNYLCISGGKECSGFTPKNTISINLASANAEEQVIKAIADEMLDCWWMFGEGNVNYVEWGVIEKTACAVCSEIAFDSELSSKLKTISYSKFYSYLEKTKRSDFQTYLQYLYSDLKNLEKGYIPSEISLDKKYGIYTGRIKPGVLFSIVPGNVSLERAIRPIILERTNSTSLGCTSFLTTP